MTKTRLALLVAALNVYLRDVQHLVGIFLMVLFYSTPIIYPIPDLGKYSAIYKANPMTALVESFHQALYWMAHPQGLFMAYAAIVAIVMFVVGYSTFLRLEPAFAEEI